MREVTKLYIPNNDMSKLNDSIYDLLQDSTSYMSLESISGVLYLITDLVKTDMLLISKDVFVKHRATPYELGLAIRLATTIIPYLDICSHVNIIGSLHTFVIDLSKSIDDND